MWINILYCFSFYFQVNCITGLSDSGARCVGSTKTLVNIKHLTNFFEYAYVTRYLSTYLNNCSFTNHITSTLGNCVGICVRSTNCAGLIFDSENGCDIGTEGTGISTGHDNIGHGTFIVKELFEAFIYGRCLS